MLNRKHIYFIAILFILLVLVFIGTRTKRNKTLGSNSNERKAIVQENQVGDNLSELIPFSDSQFIGINKEALYFLEYRNNKGKVDALLYAIYNYTSMTPRKKLLCELPESDFYFLGDMQEDKIYISPVNFREGQFFFSIEEVSTEGKRSIIYPETSAERSPIIQLIPNGLAVNFVSSGICNFKVVDLKTKAVKFNKKTNYSKNKEGKISGDYLLFSGSLDEEVIYYEVLKLQNETIEDGKTSEIHLYNFSDKIDTLIGFPENKSLAISGDRELLISSEYEFEISGNPTGKIYWKGDMKDYTSLPSIRPGYDVVNVFKTNNRNILIANTQELFLVDKNTKEIFSYSYYSYDSSQIKNSLLRQYNSNLYYLQYDWGKVFLKQISFAN